MMGKPLVSCIVPVCNAELYLRQCVSSILGQTVEDIEILLIDDGSNDGSPSLCDDLASSDRRVRVFHQENAGVSVARNKGLSEACGEYVGFVDADDWLSPDAYERCLEVMRADGTDLCIMGHREVVGSNVFDSHALDGADWPLSDRSLIRRYLDVKNKGQIASVSVSMIKRDLVEREGLRFREGLAICEDMLFMVGASQDAGHVSGVAEPLYCYRRDNGLSATTGYVPFLYEQMLVVREELGSFGTDRSLMDPWWVYTVLRCVSNECRRGSAEKTFAGRVRFAERVYSENKEALDLVGEIRGSLARSCILSADLMKLSRPLFVAACAARLRAKGL